MLWLPKGRRAAGSHWSKDSQHPALVAQLSSAGPLQTPGLHGAQVSLSPSQGSCLWSPAVPGHSHSLLGAQVMRGEREHPQNTQSRQVLPIHQPFLPTSPLCPDSGSQGHPAVPPQGSSPSPKQPWEKPCQAGFSVDSTLFQNPGQSTEL